jgi:hypothetical protein
MRLPGEQPRGIGEQEVVQRRPQGLPSSGANEWKLSNLRWSGWGTSIAVATGLYHYRHGEYRDGKLVYPVVPTRIVLSRIRVGCDGRRYYTSTSEGEMTSVTRTALSQWRRNNPYRAGPLALWAQDRRARAAFWVGFIGKA